MDVALVSVVSSSAVAIAALIVQGLNARGQRKHEALMAFEGRAWDTKSDALLRSLRASQGALDAIAQGGVVRQARALLALQSELRDVAATLEAYGSDRVRSHLSKLRKELAHCDIEEVWLNEFDAAVAQMHEEVRRKESPLAVEEAAQTRDWAQARLAESMIVRPILQGYLELYVESAREDLRGVAL